MRRAFLVGMVIVAIGAAMAVAAVDAGASASAAQGSGPDVIPMVGPVSMDTDLRALPTGPASPIQPLRLTRHGPPLNPASSDPGIAPPVISRSSATLPTPSVSFDGISSAASGCGCLPPDTNGDVGPSNYVQSVNTSLQIWNKSGTSLSGPTTLNSFFSALGPTTPCGANQNQGDPLVFYDQVSGRWVVTDFAFAAFPGSRFDECVAVSKTADPVAGGWWLYAFQVDPSNPAFLGDYPKFGVWGDGFYLSVNLFSNNTTFNGVRVYALDRSAMINGSATSAVAFTVAPPTLGDTYSLVPATFRFGAPPAGRPEYFLAVNSSPAAGSVENQVFAWRFHADFSTPANSTFGVGALHARDGTITVNNFVEAFQSSGTNIVPQLGTSALLDTLGDKLMYPLVYQNLGGAESLYVSQTVNNNQGGTGPTGIRWYQFDVTGSTIPAGAVQQQTFTNASDGLWRFMPSLAVDGRGDLTIGYSTSSATTNPAIKYAARLVGDPVNTLGQGEALLIQGAGHQTSSSGRWGDYSATAVDPSNSCTIWHTNEYYAVTSSASWATRIGAFVMPSCTPTAATLRSLAVKRARRGVFVTWRTGVETSLLGFNLYRVWDGRQVKLNPALIPAVFGGTPAGHEYTFLDRSARHGLTYTYRLQAVGVNGARNWLGTAHQKR